MTGAHIEPGQRDRQVRRVIVIEGLANAAMVATKLAVGMTTGSLAIIADAVHSVTDVLNNALAWLVMRVSSRPADRDHPYGHRKFESLAVFVLATLLVVVAFELLAAAITRDTASVAGGTVALAIMIATLGINLSLAWWQRGWARRLGSDILHADASHTLADAFTTVAVIIGWQLSIRGLPWLDRVTAVAVAGIVLWLAYGLFRRAVPILVDEAALDAGEVSDELLAIDGVNAVQQVRSRRIGTRFSVDLELSVDPTLTIVGADRLRREAAMRLGARFGDVDAVIALVPATADTRP